MACVRFNQISLDRSLIQFVNLDGATFDGSRLNHVTFEDSSLVGAIFNEQIYKEQTLVILIYKYAVYSSRSDNDKINRKADTASYFQKFETTKWNNQ